MRRESRHGELARVLALEATALAARIGIADIQISAAHSPLRSTPTDAVHGTNGDNLDPDERAVQELDRARTARRRFNDAMRAWANSMSELATLCDEWAVIRPGKLTSALWCANTNHAAPEPRDGQHIHCSFCIRIKADYGRLPNRELLDRHSRTARLSVNQIRSLLHLDNQRDAC